jgi:hypothetical protein
MMSMAVMVPVGTRMAETLLMKEGRVAMRDRSLKVWKQMEIDSLLIPQPRYCQPRQRKKRKVVAQVSSR